MSRARTGLAMRRIRPIAASFGIAALLLQLSALPASSETPSIDVETMKLKRMIDKPRRSQATGNQNIQSYSIGFGAPGTRARGLRH